MKRLLILSCIGLLLVIVYAMFFWSPDLELKLEPKEEPSVPEILADCVWSSQVKMWLDANQNGKFEESELPLSGVTVHADDTVNRFIGVDTKVTNDRGLAFLSVFLPGCPEAEFQVYADPLPGFSLTNSSRVSAPHDGTVLFGFVKIQN